MTNPKIRVTPPTITLIQPPSRSFSLAQPLAVRTSQHPSALTPSPAHLTLSLRPSQSAPPLTVKISAHSLNSLSRSARRTTSHSFSPAQPTAPLTSLIPSSSVPLAFSLAHTLALSDFLSLPSSLGLSHDR
ncbi:hypothetical protein TorRG33x02_288620 [Trema orientale]|uniref:Uncharacterized protein n=1 Tax=Trema orientale TaxID=63057 RepID=A0A2P5CEB8_TREOI|nr:hypothetical protein TorRG33x02_288620 [Trema orientale]